MSDAIAHNGGKPRETAEIGAPGRIRICGLRLLRAVVFSALAILSLCDAHGEKLSAALAFFALATDCGECRRSDQISP